MIKNYRKMEILLSDKEIQKILDKKAFAKFWAHHHTEYQDENPVKYSEEQKSWIQWIVHKLENIEKLIIHLRYWEGLTACEISSFTRFQSKTIEKIEKLALEKLRKFYQHSHAPNFGTCMKGAV